MHTREVFENPGEKLPADVIENLPPVPRQIHLVGSTISIILRFLFLGVTFVLYALIAFLALQDYSQTANLSELAIVIATFPLVFFYLPWRLYSGFRLQLESFRYYEKIFRDGVPCIGAVNMITRVSGRECHHVEHDASRLGLAKIRIDYTFEVEDAVKTGTMILPEKTVRNLGINSEICVLYLSDNVANSMIFPLPGNCLFHKG